METSIAYANIIRCFDEKCVGSRVVDKEQFLVHLLDGVGQTRFPEDGPEKGKAMVIFPPHAHYTVLAGDGEKSGDPEDYVVRAWRGDIGHYLKREKRGPVRFLGAVVHTLEAYLRDPELTREEAERVKKSGASHILVAVIAASGPGAPLTADRLVKNLAGGNDSAMKWDKRRIHQECSRSVDYWSKYWVVAD